jgi:dTDP-4-dehydrorhamnose reductase
MPSDKKKVLITGADGQLGRELVKVFEKSWSVIATDINTFDITNSRQVHDIITKKKPEWIIHCAAWTNVDAAAENPKAAMKVNGVGTKNICQAAKKVGARVVYISTNEVFNGKKTSLYKEGDTPKPINPYGESKLAGEKFCQKILGDNCVVARSAWLYGPASKNNFPNKIIKKAEEQGSLKVVTDEISSPTYTPDLAKAIKKLVDKNASGVFHLVNEGKASRYDWAKEILGEKRLNVPMSPVKLNSFQRASKPPKRAVLTNTRAKRLGVVLRNWRLANKEYLQKIKVSR